MKDITKEAIEEIKMKALEYYKNNKHINCPSLGDVKINNDGFNHIEWKNKKNKRNFNEMYVRYMCFFNLKYILEKSHLYQEYREQTETFKVKIGKGNYKVVMENTEYFGFVAIVSKNKYRIRIVIKKHENTPYYEFVSIIPAWKKNGYLGSKSNDLFFDEDLDDEDTKKS